ncbi:MAG: hypothetical protein ACOZQL_14365 [Myxococcota bacterium]
MIRAALFVLATLAVVHLLGWRENVGFLSGTVPLTSVTLATGLLYAAAWFGGVVVAPILLLAGALERLFRLHSARAARATLRP